MDGTFMTFWICCWHNRRKTCE